MDSSESTPLACQGLYNLKVAWLGENGYMYVYG